MTREEFQKTVSDRFQNTDSGFGNMTQRERILLQVASNVYDEVVKNCSIPDVARQTELIKAFLKWRLNKPHSDYQTQDYDIEQFLKEFNCA